MSDASAARDGGDDPHDLCEPLAALWTPRGRGAIATLRVQVDVRDWPGVARLPFEAANGRPLAAQPSGRAVFGRWGRQPAEAVVICPIDDRALEIHCHGGQAAAGRILQDLAQAGCAVVSWTELIHRTNSQFEAELAETLSRATTLRTASILLEQSQGLLRTSLESLLSPETDGKALAAGLEAILRWSSLGLHLSTPWKVVLAGRPNVGKSSLINALLGYTRSIVFDQPGTTRDVVTATTAVDGWPIELSDTAGLRESSESLEAAGIKRARAALADADLPLILIDVSVAPCDEDRALLDQHADAVVVAHKCDLEPFSGPGAWDECVRSQWLPVSSKTGDGVGALVRILAMRLVPEVPQPGSPVPVTPRQVSLLARSHEAARSGDLAACRASLRAILS